MSKCVASLNQAKKLAGTHSHNYRGYLSNVGTFLWALVLFVYLLEFWPTAFFKDAITAHAYNEKFFSMMNFIVKKLTYHNLKYISQIVYMTQFYLLLKCTG